MQKWRWMEASGTDVRIVEEEECTNSLVGGQETTTRIIIWKRRQCVKQYIWTELRFWMGGGEQPWKELYAKKEMCQKQDKELTSSESGFFFSLLWANNADVIFVYWKTKGLRVVDKSLHYTMHTIHFPHLKPSIPKNDHLNYQQIYGDCWIQFDYYGLAG